jgi:Fe-S cluster assembly ATPase SufC
VGDTLAQALALLEEGKDREALAFLLAPQEGPLEAERLALLGFVEARKGNLRAYRALALEAARRAQTPLTLYHLGLALPPRAGALALEEALRRTEDPQGQGRLALALNPRFLLLDEPTLGLDPVSRKELEAILLDLKGEGWGILLTSHDLESVERVSDRVVFLHRGEVLREGPTRALLREWAGEGYRLRLAEPKAEALAGALGPGWLPEAPDRLFFLGPWEALRAYLPRLDGEVLEVSRGTPSLESLFLRLFGPAPRG